MALLLHEVACADSLSLHIPLPTGERLARLCQAFIEQPDVRESPEQWAALLHVSARTFGRHFREDTGMHFSAWRQRACVVLALSRLAAGASVTEVALDFGYSSPGAFSTMFRKVLGQAPREFLADEGRPAP
jgi:AraC-like DNA-binding protein